MARKILLADDSVTAQNMGRKILVDAGYDVLTVNNGSAALKRVTESKPDLIILDVYMPGYSGLEVCQRLKESSETSYIPVLLSVGKLEPFKPQEARRVRADAHIVKPFEASELLSAIARLEDYIVPQANRSGFCSPVSSEAEFRGDDAFARIETNTDAYSGRKSGLRSTKKKKEEPESDEGAANFRDFRKARGKAPATGSFAVEPTPASAAEAISPAVEAAPAPEVGDQKTHANLADIPRDITPEELDALSAVAARLDQPAVAASPIPAAAEEAGPAAVAASVSTAADLEHVAAVAAALLAPTLVKTEDAVVAPAPEMPAAVPAKEVAVPAVEASGPAAAEIPVAHVEPAVSSATATSEQPVAAESAPVGFLPVESSPVESQAIQVQQVESQPAQSLQAESPQIESRETQEVPATAAVSSALVADEPAPVDRQDEPMFATATAEEKIEAPTGVAEEASAATASETEETKQAKAQRDEAKTEEPSGVEVAAAVPMAARAEETVEEEAPAPSDDELAEALRLLTPATGHAEALVPASPVSAESADAGFAHADLGQANIGRANSGHLAAEDTVVSEAARWMAEAVGLTPEEAAMSLEAEMFRTFAAAPAEETENAPAANRVSMITAAVENRLAEADLTVAEGATQAAADEPPKAMAAAAAAETPAAPQEETAIASIVDKVLADLRPKIVEEITKSLGKK